MALFCVLTCAEAGERVEQPHHDAGHRHPDPEFHQQNEQILAMGGVIELKEIVIEEIAAPQHGEHADTA
ncbi:MAG: hypothetical protein J4F41_09090, partial [Alphaproteobacteria bacterium]|nr:hypothetical protein [Alphaproteobacteria bacterium]